MRQFQRFLVVKIAERLQELSRQKCQGCIGFYNLDQLHHCMSVPLEKKIELFLPRIKEEALARLDNLFHIYQQTAWVEDEQVLIKASRAFITELTVDHLLDRRFVNEDSILEFPYDTSWSLSDEAVAAKIEQQVLPPILPLDPADEHQSIAPSPRKGKKRKTDN